MKPLFRVLTPAMLMAGVFVLSGCAYDMVGLSKTSAALTMSPSYPSIPGLPQFLSQIEQSRGASLGVTERAAVSTLVAEVPDALEDTQKQFFDHLSIMADVNAVALKLLIPEARRPLGDAELKTRLEKKLQRPLSALEVKEVKAANAKRVDALLAIKQNLANSVSTRVGLSASAVSGLIPLLGF